VKLFLTALGVILAATLFLLVRPESSAADGKMTMTTSVGIDGKYDDNIDFSRTGKRSDYVTTISPTLAFKYETELLNLNLNAAFKITRYLEETQENDESLRFSGTGGYQFTERLSASFDFSDILDTTLESQLAETGLVGAEGEERRSGMGGGLSYVLSEVSSLGFSYRYSRVEYDSPEYADSLSQSASLSYARQLSSQRDSVSIQTSYTGTESERNKVDSYVLSGGWSHQLSELWSGSASLGARYSEITSTQRQPEIVFDPTLWPPFKIVYRDLEVAEENWGMDISLQVRRAGEITSTSLGYSRKMGYTSYGVPTETDSFSGSFGLALTERLKTGVSAKLSYNRSESEYFGESSRQFQVNPYVNYLVTEDLTLSVGYRYANDEDFTLAVDSEAERHQVYFNLSFGFPMEL